MCVYVCLWLNLVISLEGDITDVEALKPFIECTQFIGDIYRSNSLLIRACTYTYQQ